MSQQSEIEKIEQSEQQDKAPPKAHIGLTLQVANLAQVAFPPGVVNYGLNADGTLSPVLLDGSGAIYVNAGGAAAATGLSMRRVQVAANTTPVAIKGSAGSLFYIRAYGMPSAAAMLWIKLYDLAVGSVIVGTSVPVAQYGVPFAASGTGNNIVDDIGSTFANAITAAFTMGFADADTTAPTANTWAVNFGYK